MNSDLTDLLAAFDREHVRYLIVGGYAVSFHAEPRYTKDIDLFIATDPENAHAVFRVLCAFGAPLEGVTAEDFQNADLFYQVGLPPNRVDILMGIPGVEFQHAWEGRVRAVVDGLPLLYMGLDDLIAAKRAAGREQDLLDAKKLETIRDAAGDR